MIDQTKIEWTDFTVNFWEGCQKVGPGCGNCYAETRDKRFTGGKHWGPGAPRRKVKGGVTKLRKIQKEARNFHAETGHWPRVFCSSLSDIFDNAVDEAWRIEAINEMEMAKDTRPMLLTKRVGNVQKMVERFWGGGLWPQHIGLMITVVNQAEADRDIPKLLDLKARLGIPWVGLSMEPLLGPVDLTRIVAHRCENERLRGDGAFTVNMKSGAATCPSDVDWVIVGGESGPNARPPNPQWFRDLRDQCQAARTPYLFKQWGEWVSVSEVASAGMHHHFEDGRTVRRTGKKHAGRLLDGREWNGMPEALTQDALEGNDDGHIYSGG